MSTLPEDMRERVHKITNSLGSDCIQISGTEYEGHFGERVIGADNRLMDLIEEVGWKAREDEQRRIENVLIGHIAKGNIDMISVSIGSIFSSFQSPSKESSDE